MRTSSATEFDEDGFREVEQFVSFWSIRILFPRTIVETDPPGDDEPSTSDRSPQDSSSPGKNYSDVLEGSKSVEWKRLDTALRFLEKSADACPPLKSAIGGLVACVDQTQVSYCFWSHILDRF